ncbi:hypothetical protein N9V51_02495 [Candidatus Actinomarina sp.]|nr:hypothetical protein [Candidatus Actinomarina sp.]
MENIKKYIYLAIGLITIIIITIFLIMPNFQKEEFSQDVIDDIIEDVATLKEQTTNEEVSDDEATDENPAFIFLNDETFVDKKTIEFFVGGVPSSNAVIIIEDLNNIAVKKIKYSELDHLRNEVVPNEGLFCTTNNSKICENLKKYRIPFEQTGNFLISFQNNKSKSFFLSRKSINPEPECRVGLVFPNFTWQAYNPWGEVNFYAYKDQEQQVISTLRPLDESLLTTNYHSSPYRSQLFLSHLKTNGICAEPLLNSDLHETDDWENLDLMVLTVHDEYWTSDLRNKLEKWVRRGGKLLIISGNTAWTKVTYKNNKLTYVRDFILLNQPLETTTGLSFRYAGYDLKTAFTAEEAAELGVSQELYEKSSGIKVLKSEHPIFESTGLKNGDFFGVKSRVIWQEMDGIPLNVDNDTLKPETAENFPPNIEVLGSAWGGNPRIKTIFYYGNIVFFNKGMGKVLNLGSIGWSESLRLEDEIPERIIINSVNYLLKN